MIGSLIGQIELMSLAEGMHTAAFTAFILTGVVCCFKRSDKGGAPRPVRRELTAGPKTNAHRPRRRRSTSATVRVASRPRQLSLPLGRVAA
jgi:predicted component of type VI protein secretion system